MIVWTIPVSVKPEKLIDKSIGKPVYECLQKLCAQLLRIKSHKMSSVSKWVHKLWYIHIVKYYSVIKRNYLLSHQKKKKKTHGGNLSALCQVKKPDR